MSSQNAGEKLTIIEGDITKEMKDSQPDLLSKLREVAIAGPSKETIQWTIVGVSQTEADVRAKQLQDPNIEAVLQAKEANSKPGKEVIETLSPACRHYLLWENLKLVDGVLIKEFTKQDQSAIYGQILVPEDMKRPILRSMHECLLAGHMGAKKTKTKILQRFYWFNLKENVKVIVRQCDTCGCDKKPFRTPRAPMGSVRTWAPWDVVATDYLGPFPVTRRGNRYILVLTDYFSKFVDVIPVTDMSAETCTLKVLN